MDDRAAGHVPNLDRQTSAPDKRCARDGEDVTASNMSGLDDRCDGCHDRRGTCNCDIYNQDSESGVTQKNQAGHQIEKLPAGCKSSVKVV